MATQELQEAEDNVKNAQKELEWVMNSWNEATPLT